MERGTYIIKMIMTYKLFFMTTTCEGLPMCEL